MQALYLRNKQLTVTDNHPVPQPQPGEALIRITMAGICSTDLELVKGYYPFDGVLGHEFVGIVEAVASEIDEVFVGQRVVGEINISAECNANCERRCPEHCPDRTVLGIVDKDGAFASYVTLPVCQLFEVPDYVSDRQAVFTEPLAAAVRIVEQVNVTGKQCAVIGPGRLGMLAAQVLRLAGGTVVVIGRSQESLALPQELGFETAHADQLSPESFAVIVETTGNPAGFETAVTLIEPNGSIVLKSTYAEDARFASIAPLMSKVVVNEIRLVGSRCGPFGPALSLLAEGSIDVEGLISAEYPLRDGLAAFDFAAQRGVRKVLLIPDKMLAPS